MNKQILKSMLVIGLVAASTTVAATQALFTDAVEVQNNTFSTGHSDLKIYYREGYGSCFDNSAMSFDADGDGDATDGYVVECTNPDHERVALNYGADTASTFDVAHHWYDGLSSPVDFTNIYPGWLTNTDGRKISERRVYPNVGDGNILSLGNAGTVPMANVTMVVTTESLYENEGLEPLDGSLPGGDNIDPFTDGGWSAQGREYRTNLANQIHVMVESVNADESVNSVPYRGTLADLIAAGPITVTNGTLDVGDVAHVRLNWELPSGVTEADANKVFDFTMQFDAQGGV